MYLDAMSIGYPTFKNDRGVPDIRIGVKEFECVGASPSMDHPRFRRSRPTASSGKTAEPGAVPCAAPLDGFAAEPKSLLAGRHRRVLHRLFRHVAPRRT
jgi:hypothetical protein